MFFKTTLGLAAVLIAGVIPVICHSKANATPIKENPVSSPEAQTPVENILSGQVVKVSPKEILLKQQEDRSNIVLHLLPATDIWEGLWVKSVPIAVGDRIKAKVKRRSDGVFEAQKIWINVINLVGDVSKVEKKANGLLLKLQNRYLGSVVVVIDPRTEVTLKGKQVTFSNSPVELHAGEQVRIIGRRLRNGVVIATNLLFEQRRAFGD